MQLKVGLSLQLQPERFAHQRLQAMLIGYLVDQAVIITMPAVAAEPLGIVEGDRFVCRALAGRVALAFRTQVVKVAKVPFPHLFLAYPQGVETVTVRKALRMPIHQEVVLLKDGVPEKVREAAVLVDISLLGAGAVAKPEFAAVSNALALLLPPLETGGAEVPIPVTVKNVRPLEADNKGTAPQCYYGLEFGELGSEARRAVDRIFQDHLKRGGGF